MTFQVHSIDSAPAGSRPPLEKIVSSYGFLPNLAAGLAESPAVLNGFLGLAGAYDTEAMTLDAVERQIVLLTTSVANDCDYCTAAHSMLAHRVGVEPAEVDRLRAGEALSDERLEALHAFTQTVVAHRGRLDEEQVGAFLRAGYTHAQALEVVLGVTLKTLTNYANHLIRPEINAEFAPRRAA